MVSCFFKKIKIQCQYDKSDCLTFRYKKGNKCWCSKCISITETNLECLQTEVLAILVAVVVLSVGYKEEVVHL